MKNPCLALTAIAFIQFIAITQSLAQTGSLKTAPAKVTIDGNLGEWGDSLNFTNAETGLHYTLANDKENLYLVVKTADPMQQHAILTNGLTLGIDTKGHKKTAYTILFPYPENEVTELSFHPTEQEKRQAINELKLKRLQAEGFKDVEVDVFTQENLYGIRAAANYDEQGNLIYEELIPLKLFHTDINPKTDWAFNIKLNEPELKVKKPAEGSDNNQAAAGGRGGRGGMGGGRGGMGGGGMGGGGRHGGMGSGGVGVGRGSYGDHTNDSATTPKGVDFWTKLSLAN